MTLSVKHSVVTGAAADPSALVDGPAWDANHVVNFTQSGTGAVARTLDSKLQDVVSVKDFGAVGDGITDDSAAIQAALNSGARAVFMPSAQYSLSSGITVPANVTLYSEGVAPCNPSAGCQLVFATGVATCVTLDGTNNKSPGLRNLTVTRTGTPVSTTIGVLIKNGFNVVIENVGSFNHGIGFQLQGDGSAAGIGCMAEKLFTGAIQDAHVVINSWPEARFSECRFGWNGSGDVACTAYVRITGGSTNNPANGPNTIEFVHNQFNQGGAQKATSLCEWVNMTPGYVSEISTFKFIGNHIEQAINGFKTDATLATLFRLFVIGNTFHTTGDVWNVNSATNFLQIWITANHISGAFSLGSGSNSIQKVQVVGNEIDGLTTLTGSSANDYLASSGNVYAGGVTLAGTWNLLLMKDISNLAGGVTNTISAGAYAVDIPFGNTGHVISGKGSTNDVTLKGTAGNVLSIPTGTQNAGFSGNITTTGGAYIGTSVSTDRTVAITKTLTGATTYWSQISNGTVQSDVTSSAGYYRTNINTQATAFTLSNLYHFSAAQGTIGAGSTVTNQYGHHVDSSMTGATNNYGFYSALNSGTGRWAFYGNGTAASFFGGTVASANAITAMSNTAVPAGGTAGAGLMMSSTANLGVFFGSGAPTLSATQGSLYIRTDGSSTSTRLYVNTNGTTGWTNVTTAT